MGNYNDYVNFETQNVRYSGFFEHLKSSYADYDWKPQLSEVEHVN